MFDKIKELYRYRSMIWGLVHRDLRGRYKGSFLGFFWTFLNPLMQLGVYTVLFSVIFKTDIQHYYLFLFVALIPWIFFSTCLSVGSTCVLNQGNMVTKIYFPREVLPISFVTSQFVNMMYCFVVIFAVLIFTRHGINLHAVLYLPLFFAVEYLMCLGVTLLFSGITVYVRDFANILQVLAMLFQFMTPVMYSISSVPQKLVPLFRINPMCPIIEGYRQILYYKQIPALSEITFSVIDALIVFVIGEFVFSKLQKGFAEEL